MTKYDYKFLIKEKFNDIDYSFENYCEQGFAPEEAFEKACKENNIDSWL